VEIAIDERDALWLIEANDRPQSSLHEHDHAVHTIGYARRLAMQRAGSLAAAD
jgi:hypothetical protein